MTLQSQHPGFELCLEQTMDKNHLTDMFAHYSSQGLRGASQHLLYVTSKYAYLISYQKNRWLYEYVWLNVFLNFIFPLPIGSADACHELGAVLPITMQGSEARKSWLTQCRRGKFSGEPQAVTDLWCAHIVSARAGLRRDKTALFTEWMLARTASPHQEIPYMFAKKPGAVGQEGYPVA